MINRRFFVYGILITNLLVAMEKDLLENINQGKQLSLFSQATRQLKKKTIRKIGRETIPKIDAISNEINSISHDEIENTDVSFDCKDGLDNDVCCLFLHGFGATQEQIEAYKSIYGGFRIKASFNFPDVKHWINGNLGQTKDVRAFYCAFKKTVSFLIGKNIFKPSIFLVGVSRGASTLLNGLGVMSYLKIEDLKYIKGAIAESPFRHMNDIYVQTAKNLFSFSCGDDFAMQSVDSCKDSIIKVGSLSAQVIAPHYDPRGLHPGNIITKISPNIALLFISSKKDMLIPYTSTECLYEKLKDRSNVHHLVLDKGRHAQLLTYFVLDKDTKKYKVETNRTYLSKASKFFVKYV